MLFLFRALLKERKGTLSPFLFIKKQYTIDKNKMALKT